MLLCRAVLRRLRRSCLVVHVQLGERVRECRAAIAHFVSETIELSKFARGKQFDDSLRKTLLRRIDALR